MSHQDTVSPHDLADALRAADALDNFRDLPEDARHMFEEWIGKARDEEAYWRRIGSLVLALRAAPRLLTQTDVTARLHAGPGTVPA